jgi:hypothetical protein
MANTYLVLAYILLWAIFIVYTGLNQRRQHRLEKQLEELQGALRERQKTAPLA